MEQSSIRVVPALLAGGLELVREDRCERWQLAHFVGSLSVSRLSLPHYFKEDSEKVQKTSITR